MGPSVRQAALASLALLATTASATTKYFEFPGCVYNCISANACNGNTKCMCASARATSFLNQIVSCAVPACASGGRAVSMKTQFIDVMDDGCDALRMGIPKDKLKAAEKLAASLVQKLPPPTQAQPSPTANPPDPTNGPPGPPPPPPPPLPTSKETEAEPQPTTSRDRGGGGDDSSSTSQVPDTLVPPQSTEPAVTTPPSETTYPPPAQTPTQAPPPPPPPPPPPAGRPDPTDSTPFALPIGAAPSLSVRSPWLWAGFVGAVTLWL